MRRGMRKAYGGWLHGSGDNYLDLLRRISGIELDAQKAVYSNGRPLAGRSECLEVESGSGPIVHHFKRPWRKPSGPKPHCWRAGSSDPDRGYCRHGRLSHLSIRYCRASLRDNSAVGRRRCGGTVVPLSRIAWQSEDSSHLHIGRYEE